MKKPRIDIQTEIKLWKAAIYLLWTLAAFFFVAEMTYAFRHPHMTDTERALHIADVIRFR